MKNRILVTAAVVATMLSASTGALAERKYGRAGCGLGSIVFGPGGNQSSAAISNGTGVQTVGITLGTSNCAPAGSKEAATLDQENFFVANYATLSKEIAQGGGDTVVGFAGVLGCDSAETGAVAAHLKGEYTQIFAAPGAVAAFESARDSLRTEPKFIERCQYL